MNQIHNCQALLNEAVRLFSGRLVIESLNSCEKETTKKKALEAP